MPELGSATTPMDLSPMTKKEAVKLVYEYLAGFPYSSCSDPHAYQMSLICVMQQYPRWAGRYAITQVNPNGPQLPASEKLMRRWLAGC